MPVATAYTAADIFADPHMAARHDLVTVEDPVIGAVRQQAPFPRVAGTTPAAPAGAPRLGAHTREVLGALGVDARRARRSAREGDRVTTVLDRACTDGLFELHADGTLDLIGGYSPTSDRFHFPLLADLPVHRRGRRASASLLSRARHAVGVDRGDRGAARLRGPDAVRLRRRRARRASSSGSSPGSPNPIPTRLQFGQPMTLVADDLHDGVVTWAFTPAAAGS